jgi:hypothetical protein
MPIEAEGSAASKLSRFKRLRAISAAHFRKHEKVSWKLCRIA